MCASSECGFSQVNSRSQQPGGSSAAAAGPLTAEDRESQLSSQLKLLQEELSTAYEKAAQATSHVSQYQALAESSDQALKAMQVHVVINSQRYLVCLEY